MVVPEVQEVGALVVVVRVVVEVVDVLELELEVVAWDTVVVSGRLVVELIVVDLVVKCVVDTVELVDFVVVDAPVVVEVTDVVEVEPTHDHAIKPPPLQECHS